MNTPKTRSLIRAVRSHLDLLQSSGVTLVPAAPRLARPTAAGPAAPALRPHAVPASPEQATERRARLGALAQRVRDCRKCSLFRTRTNMVLSDGSPLAKLVFIGEAPGREEDLRGLPFVGAAGELLTKMIGAIGLRREDVYICNVLKDRPPGNRTPEPEEVGACLPFLQEQIDIVKPIVICTLGSVAAKALLGQDVSITRIRGQVREYNGIPLIPTFHPAYLLRNPPAKKYAWVDLKLVRQMLDRS